MAFMCQYHGGECDGCGDCTDPEAVARREYEAESREMYAEWQLERDREEGDTDGHDR